MVVDINQILLRLEIQEKNTEEQTEETETTATQAAAKAKEKRGGS